MAHGGRSAQRGCGRDSADCVFVRTSPWLAIRWRFCRWCRDLLKLPTRPQLACCPCCVALVCIKTEYLINLCPVDLLDVHGAILVVHLFRLAFPFIGCCAVRSIRTKPRSRLFYPVGSFPIHWHVKGPVRSSRKFEKSQI